jgi:hypothetical protein
VYEYAGPFKTEGRAQNAKYHPGTDLAARSGIEDALALVGGRVIFAGDTGNARGGNTVNVETVKDGVTFYHSYAHLSAINVQKGQIVPAGFSLGKAGRTGNIDWNTNANSVIHRNYPTHVHFYLKRRSESHTARIQKRWGKLPGSTGYFAHRPGSETGPRVALQGVSISEENIKSVAENSETFHLLPCAGQPHPNTNMNRPSRCINLPVSIREAGGLANEQNAIRNTCWARRDNKCPWERVQASELSRYYQFLFNGEELVLNSIPRHQPANLPAWQVDNTEVKSSITHATPLRLWRAYSGEPVPGSLVRKESGVVWDTYFRAKRFKLDAATQALKNEGPIPAGEYSIDANDLHNMEAIGVLRRYLKYTDGTWGGKAAPLVPLDGTDMLGRGGFWVHGGNEFGNAGGIDLREQDEDFSKYLVADPDGVTKFKVVVEYTQAFTEARDETIECDE